MLDFRTEQHLSLRASDGSARLASLPDLLSALGKGEDVTLTHLQQHQEHAMHAFVVQLMVHLLDKELIQSCDASSKAYADALLSLGGEASAWHLIVDDSDKPALMQPGVKNFSYDENKRSIAADELDILVKAKNFDVKRTKLTCAKPEVWFFAILTLQTSCDYGGGDTQRIARMAHAHGTRVWIATYDSLAWGARVVTDVKRWLSVLPSLREEFGYDRDGHRLLWLVDWSDDAMLEYSQLHPAFIEIARRVRLKSGSDGAIIGYRHPSKNSRIYVEGLNGLSGDIWVPVTLSDSGPTVFGVTKTGLDYRKLNDLVFEQNLRASRAQDVSDLRGDTIHFFGQALAREKGKTKGLYRRILPIPAKRRGILRRGPERDKLAARSKAQIEMVRDIRTILYKSLKAIYVPAEQNHKNASWPSDLIEPYDLSVDQLFFGLLFETAENDESDFQKAVYERLRVLATDIFEQAIERVNDASTRHYKNIHTAKMSFYGGFKKTFSKFQTKEK